MTDDSVAVAQPSIVSVPQTGSPSLLGVPLTDPYLYMGTDDDFGQQVREFVTTATNFPCRSLCNELATRSPPLTLAASVRYILVDAQTMAPETMLGQLTWQPAYTPGFVLLRTADREQPIAEVQDSPVVGIFTADDSFDTVCRGLRAVFDGDLWLPRKVLVSRLQKASQPLQRAVNAGEAVNDPGPIVPTTTKTVDPAVESLLTPKELKVLCLVAQGKTNQEIADKLFMSIHTVKTHLQHVFRKLNAGNRVQAIRWAQEHHVQLAS